jgi:hypothetical protein
MNLSLDDLNNIRFALNEKIHALIVAGVNEGGNPLHLSQATSYAETRDRIQAEIEMRQGAHNAPHPGESPGN